MNASQVGFNPDYVQDAPTISQIRALADYVILEFGTPWCGHCIASSPAVEDVLTELKLPHIKVFDGKGKLLGRQFQVKLWPTLILLHSGEEIARLVRPSQAKDVRELVAHIEQ